MRTLASYVACVILATTAGCASWFLKGEPPEVLVVNVVPLEATALEQRLQVDLRIRNPNDFDLFVTGIDFTLKLNGKRLARGLSNKDFTVPRLGDTVVSVQTSASTFDVVRQLLSFSRNQDLSYDITGLFHLKDGRLPFDNSGILLEKDHLSNLPSP
jgi:LEA14-like dessication related protein